MAEPNYRYRVCKGSQVIALTTTAKEAQAEARKVDGRVERIAENPRPAKGTPTAINLEVLAEVFGGQTRVPNTFKASHTESLRRCQKAGLLAVDGSFLVLTDAGRTALANVGLRASSARRNPKAPHILERYDWAATLVEQLNNNAMGWKAVYNRLEVSLYQSAEAAALNRPPVVILYKSPNGDFCDVTYHDAADVQQYSQTFSLPTEADAALTKFMQLATHHLLPTASTAAAAPQEIERPSDWAPFIDILRQTHPWPQYIVLPESPQTLRLRRPSPSNALLTVVRYDPADKNFHVAWYDDSTARQFTTTNDALQYLHERLEAEQPLSTTAAPATAPAAAATPAAVPAAAQAPLPDLTSDLWKVQVHQYMSARYPQLFVTVSANFVAARLSRGTGTRAVLRKMGDDSFDVNAYNDNDDRVAHTVEDSDAALETFCDYVDQYVLRVAAPALPPAPDMQAGNWATSLYNYLRARYPGLDFAQVSYDILVVRPQHSSTSRRVMIIQQIGRSDFRLTAYDDNNQNIADLIDIPAEEAVGLFCQWVDSYVVPFMSPAAQAPATAPAPVGRSSFPDRVEGRHEPLRNLKYYGTFIAPKCDTPVAFGSCSFNQRFNTVVYAPNDKERPFCIGYFGGDYDDAHYMRQHMGPGLMKSSDKGVGPACYMAGPLIIAADDPSVPGTFSAPPDGGYGYRTDKASQAWENAVRHGTAYNVYEGIIRTQVDTLPLVELVKRNQSTDLLRGTRKYIAGAEPAKVTVLSAQDVVQQMDFMTMLKRNIILHLEPHVLDALKRNVGYKPREVAMCPPPQAFGILDFHHCDARNIEQYLEFCSTHRTRGVTKKDYLIAALEALKTNASAPMTQGEIQQLLDRAQRGARRRNPAVTREDEQDFAKLRAFLDDPTWD